ncbi:MAG: hypothetical protein PW734_06915 [Verrucomicrobium sp.]|nr:hypothetical protein [Verrucomicrobium sp.]
MNSSFQGIYFDASQIVDKAAALTAKEKDIQPAMRKAITRTARWASGELRRRSARKVRVTGRVIKGRMGLFLQVDKARVFFGMDPISLSRLNPKKTNSGIKAGPVTVPGGFFIPKAGKNVFTRVGKGRFPIEKAEGVHIENEGQSAIDSILPDLEPRIWNEFERELNWQRIKETRSR